MTEPGSHRHVGLNGAVVDAAAARISPLGEGFLYGRGLFETIKVTGGRAAFFSDHAERLARGAAELGLAWRTPEKLLRERSAEVIAANGLTAGALKIVVFEDEAGPGELILTRENAYPPELYARGFALKAVDDGQRAGRLPGLKTLNYLRNLCARRAVQAAEFDEVLFVGADGSVLEGAGTNVFVVAGEQVLTPPADGGILPGIARSWVLRLLPPDRIREQPIAAPLLYAADEIFVTNSLLGVMPVSRVDEHSFDVGRNSVTRSLMETFRRAEADSVTA